MRLEPGGMTTAAASTGPERQAAPTGAQEVELRPTGDAMSHEFDLLDPGCVDHEGALHADTAGDATDGDLTVDSASAQAHHRALEHLDPFTIALDALHADAHRVA